MAQRYRIDYPGAWHHVVNRGIARRPIFTTADEVDRFLELLGREVEDGRIEIHAFSVLTTHFHLLVRSPDGRCYRALMRSQNVYAREFNRGHRRDGPLFRGRFHSSHVTSETHWRNVVRYIDFNPVEARLASVPEDHPFGSARTYYGGPEVPWLARNAIEDVVRGELGDDRAGPDGYRRLFGVPPGSGERHCVESRLRARVAQRDELDDLVAAAPSRVREWMERKALLADGCSPGRPVVRPATVDRALRRMEAELSLCKSSVGGVPRPVGPVLRAGLLRDAAGCSWSQVADRLGMSVAGAFGVGRTHERLLQTDAAYAELAGRALRGSLDLEWPADGRIRRPGVTFVAATERSARDKDLSRLGT